MRLLFAFIALVGIGPGAQSLRTDDPSSLCAATPRADRLPGMIAPSAGQDPVWFVDGGGGRWHGSAMPIKSAWILRRDVAGDLHVTGRNIQSGESLTFRTGMSGPVTPSLTIEHPLDKSMTPGGSMAETMRKFAFVSSYIFYPSAGCWELQMRFGNHERTIRLSVM